MFNARKPRNGNSNSPEADYKVNKASHLITLFIKTQFFSQIIV